MINNPRTCIISKKRLNKSELIRFVIKENQLIADKNQVIKQRGYYIHKSINILTKAKKIEFFKKRFNVKNEQDVLNQIISDIS